MNTKKSCSEGELDKIYADTGVTEDVKTSDDAA
jgi:hypothetical protein